MPLSDREVTLCFAGTDHPGFFCKECAGYAIIEKGKVKLKMACAKPCDHKIAAKILRTDVEDLLRHASVIDEVRDYVQRRG